MDRQKKPSGNGTGKWQTFSSLERYRVKRDKAQRQARLSRRRNRR
jgi:hypothetical protein